MGILISIAGLGLVIFIHELGHFLAGKAVGIKIHEFMLGLPIGPKLWSFKRGETTYGVSAFLLGGYVRPAEAPQWGPLTIADVAPGSAADVAGFRKGDVILLAAGKKPSDWFSAAQGLSGGGEVTVSREGGEVVIVLPEAGVSDGIKVDPSNALDISELPRTVEARSSLQKLILVAAGPIMNVVLAYVLIFIVFLSGFPGEPSTKLASVVKGSPAARVGVKAGDRVISINGRRLSGWPALQKAVRSRRGKEIDFKVNRGGKVVAFRAKLGNDPKKGLLGVIAGVERKPIGPLQATVRAAETTWVLAGAVVESLATLVTVPSKIVGNLRSPIGAVAETAPVAQSNFLAYLGILAQLSIGIGILNLLPIPPLDGGRVVVSLFEGLTGRSMPKEILAAVNFIGVSILLFLMTYLIVGDIFRLAAPGGG